jgi:hypothetical protein
MSRDEKILVEARTLWRHLRGAPPPAGADGGALLTQILQGMGAPAYERLRDRNLRAVTLPR